MQTASEIRSCLKNIKYYSDKLIVAATIQFNDDFEKGSAAGINTGPGTVRFECLANIIAGANELKVFSEGMENITTHAEAQDKKLWGEDYKEEEET